MSNLSLVRPSVRLLVSVYMCSIKIIELEIINFYVVVYIHQKFVEINGQIIEHG